MNWISVDDELPDNNTLCWAYIPNRGIILRLFSGDGFGLGDLDFEVAYWTKYRAAEKPNCTIIANVRSVNGLHFDEITLDYSDLKSNLVL